MRSAGSWAVSSVEMKVHSSAAMRAETMVTNLADRLADGTAAARVVLKDESMVGLSAELTVALREMMLADQSAARLVDEMAGQTAALLAGL